MRERVFLIGSRDGTPFEFPATTLTASGRAADCFSRTRSSPIGQHGMRSATCLRIPNEPSLDDGGLLGGTAASIPEGQNYLWHTNRGGGQPLFGWRTRYWSFLLKLAKNQPSWTIQAQPGSSIGPFHWRNRKLSAHEMCRLQTFPDGLVFDCGRG